MKIELTYLQLLFIGMGVGFVLGLIPLILGIIKGKKRLAIWGLVASIAAGTIQSLLALVTIIIFIWLILRKPAGTEIVQAESVNESPNDVSITNSENVPENKVSGD